MIKLTDLLHERKTNSNFQPSNWFALFENIYGVPQMEQNQTQAMVVKSSSELKHQKNEFSQKIAKLTAMLPNEHRKSKSSLLTAHRSSPQKALRQTQPNCFILFDWKMTKITNFTTMIHRIPNFYKKKNRYIKLVRFARIRGFLKNSQGLTLGSQTLLVNDCSQTCLTHF